MRAGEYRFAVGTAGSTGLVRQTVLMPLLLADAPSRIVLEGGTHNMLAPPFEFIARAFLPVVNRLGARMPEAHGPGSILLLEAERVSFTPAGDGAHLVCAGEG